MYTRCRVSATAFLKALLAGRARNSLVDPLRLVLFRRLMILARLLCTLGKTRHKRLLHSLYIRWANGDKKGVKRLESVAVELGSGGVVLDLA